MSVSKQGVWIDCKALLFLTYQLNNVLSNKDRILFGDKLIQSNLSMIESFAMTYHRADERIVYDNGDKIYEGVIKGCKQIEVDRLRSHFETYKAIWEFVFDNITTSRWSAEKRARKEAEFVALLVKIETGINKWRMSIYKQVVISVKGHNPA